MWKFGPAGGSDGKVTETQQSLGFILKHNGYLYQISWQSVHLLLEYIS